MFGSIAEVIAATAAYFEVKDGIESYKSVGMIVSHMKMIMLMDKNEYEEEVRCHSPGTY